MENLVGKTVWVVEFFDKNFMFCDENGVYTSRERALASIENDFHLNKGYWVNRTLVFDTELSRCETFYCEGIKVEVCMYETNIW